MSNVPKLRFPEFSGEWAGKCIADVTLSLDYGLNSAAIPYDGINQYLRITDIDEATRTYTTGSRVSPDGSLDDHYLLKEGDILFARTGASTGKSFYYTSKYGKMYFAGYLIRLRLCSGVSSKYLYYNTLTKKYRTWVKTMSMRSGQPGINAKEYGLYQLGFPSKDEQTKIADLLTLIDKKIAKQDEKVAALEEYKKGLMQKIFSREIRFKDDNGKDYPEWGEVKLGEVGTTYGGLSNKTKNDFGLGSKKYITYMNVFNNTIAAPDLVESVKIGPAENQNPVAYGDILFTTSSETPDEVGMSSVWLGNSNEIYLNSFCFGYRLYDPKLFDPYFMAYLLRAPETRKAITIFSQGSTRFNLSKLSLMKMQIKIPIKAEQTKIANFLSLYDRKIEKEKAKLEALREQKKGLLQQMFV